MRNSFRTSLSAVAALLAVVSCSDKAVVSGRIDGAGSVIVKTLATGTPQAIDTLSTTGGGNFTCKLDIPEGQPEFVYLYSGDRKISSLVVSRGDRITVKADTLGECSVDGSPESVKLMAVESEYSDFMGRMSRAVATASTDEEASREASRLYVEYYRSRLAYVVANSKSMTAIPVLYQKVNQDLPVFSQSTDALIFKAVADSLKTVYPDSRYVRQLEREASRRRGNMDVENMLRGAGAVGYPEIELPGMDSSPVKLSESLSKVTMVYFWASTDEQKMFNMDALIPIYEQFHSKGLEIYAVSLDVDKGAWAAAVRNQALPWVNVCDIRGIDSPLISMYGITSLPTVYFIVDDEIDSEASVEDGSSIRSYLSKKLR